MRSVATARARRLLQPSAGSVNASRLLSIIHALAVLAILLVLGALLALSASRGRAELSADAVAAIPSRVLTYTGAAVVNQARPLSVRDAGLLPTALANWNNSNLAHRATARILDAFISRIPTLRNNTGALATLLAVGLSLALTVVVLDQLRWTRAVHAACSAASALRVQIHRQMYRLGHSALPNEGISGVVNLFSREVNDVRDGLLAEIDHIPRSIILFFGLITIAASVSWVLTLGLLALVALAAMAVRSMERAARFANEGLARDVALQLCLLQEDLSLLRTVRVFAVEETESDRFQEHLDRFEEADFARLKAYSPWSQSTVLVLAIAVVIAMGLITAAILSDQLSLGSAVLLALAIAGLVKPLRDWQTTESALRLAGRSAGLIFEYLDRRPELQQTAGAHFLSPLKDRISFDGIVLDGPDGRRLLDGANAQILAGSKTAILGLDEDACQALVCLIPRLIDPRQGRIRIDGRDLREVTLESIRAQVAMVLQADLAFSDSVFVNIGLRDPSYDLPRVIEAAKIAHAHHFIQDLPHGYDTPIGPQGHYLRVDEQYRIALARAFLHDPSIVIIEEPSVPLDDDIKHLLDDTISRLSQGRTAIFLPHRLSTIRSCSHAIVLLNGRVEAEGNPKELQAKSKLFRHLQYIEFNQFAQNGEIEAGQLAT